jgi:hypothetical protein
VAALEIGRVAADETGRVAADGTGGVAADEVAGVVSGVPVTWPVAAAPEILAARPLVLDGRRPISRLLGPVRDPAPGLSPLRPWDAAGAAGSIRHDARPRGRDDRVELDVADALARALHDEADLRGLAR